MRRSESVWIRTIVLLLIIGMMGCSGMKATSKDRPQEDAIKIKEVKSEEAGKPSAAPQQPPAIPQPPPSPQAQVTTPTPKPAKPASSAPPMVPPSTPPGPASPPVLPAPAPKGGGVVFNFDNADLYEVIRVMAEILRINYIIDPKVRGVVNINTLGRVSVEDVFPIFQSILQLNGATAVKKDNLYEIIPLTDAKKLSIPPSTSVPREPGKLPSDERYIIQIVPLKYIPVTEVSKIIKPFLTDGADIIEHPPHNMIIIGDLYSNVKKSLDIINLFDLDIFTDMRVRIYPILNADVTEVAKEMERIFASFEVSTKSGRGVGITFTPITRINSLLAVSAIPNIFERVEGWLKELDKIPTEGSKYSVFVYHVQNMKAKDLAEVLKQVFMGVKEKKEEFKQKVAEPPVRGPRPPTTTPPPAAVTPEAAAVPEGEINIAVDETNNALVIRAFARDYRNILETIKKLDIYPRQVLIEVLLVDISLNEDTQFGVEWSRFLTSNSPNAQNIVFGAQPPTSSTGTLLDPFIQPLSGTVPGGIRYAIVELGGRVSAAIRAAAADGRVKVLISPHILASNNKEAKIQIGSTEPIPTGSFVTGATTTTTSGIVDVPIEYKDIGIILSVTPRISDGGLVTLEISVENSSLGELKTVGPLTNAPSFNKTTAKTVLSIMEGQSIALGGLIRDDKNFARSGIPLLKDIPLIGFLFGSRTRTSDKREMILLLTPHVITDQTQSKTVTQEFKERVEGIKRELEKDKKK